MYKHITEVIVYKLYMMCYYSSIKVLGTLKYMLHKHTHTHTYEQMW